MNIEHLVSMANDIANFFEGDHEPAEAAAGVALHISRYWDPRMRRHIHAHVAKGGDGLKPTALAAIRSLPPVRETAQALG